MYQTLLGGFVREFGYSFEEVREGARRAGKLCANPKNPRNPLDLLTSENIRHNFANLKI